MPLALEADPSAKVARQVGLTPFERSRPLVLHLRTCHPVRDPIVLIGILGIAFHTSLSSFPRSSLITLASSRPWQPRRPRSGLDTLALSWRPHDLGVLVALAATASSGLCDLGFIVVASRPQQGTYTKIMVVILWWSLCELQRWPPQ